MEGVGRVEEEGEGEKGDEEERAVSKAEAVDSNRVRGVNDLSNVLLFNPNLDILNGVKGWKQRNIFIKYQGFPLPFTPLLIAILIRLLYTHSGREHRQGAQSSQQVQTKMATISRTFPFSLHLLTKLM